MPKPKPAKSKSSKSSKKSNTQELPDDIIPQLVCQLKEISIVLLILISPTYITKYPTIKLLQKLIQIAIEILLNDNTEPIKFSDSKTTKKVNKNITTIKESKVMDILKPYLEEYRGENIEEGIKQLYIYMHVINLY